MRIKLFSFLLFLFGLLASSLSLACDERRSRDVVDAILNRDIPRAEHLVTVWQTEKPSSLRMVLYQAIVQVAIADYSPQKTSEKYDASLNQLKTVIHYAESGQLIEADQAQRQLILATAKALVARLLMEQHHWIGAYRYGHGARQILTQLIQKHPQMEDAYVAMGLFDYYTGSVPVGLKWLTLLLDFSGDTRRGIRYLERAVEHAPTTAPEAARVLLNEVRHQDAETCRYLPLADQLVRHFPNNPGFRRIRQRYQHRCTATPLESRQPAWHAALAVAHCDE